MSPTQSPIRFSLATMIGIFCLVGIYCTAIRFPTDLWAGACVSLTLTILGITLVWRFTSPTADSVFWAGFHVAGFSYAALALILAPHFGAASSGLLAPKLLSYLHSHMPLTSPETVQIEWHGTWYPGSIIEQRGFQYRIHYTGYDGQWDEWIAPTRLRAGGLEEFLQTGNAFLTLFIAALGGIWAKCYPPWSRLGVKIAVIVGIIAWVVLGTISLFIPNENWTSIVFTTSFAALVAMTIGAIIINQPRSAFLVGFALCAWCYFVMHFGPLGGSVSSPNLLTTRVIALLQNLLHPDSVMPVAPGQPYMYTTSSANYWQVSNSTTTSFQIIGHAHLMMIVGVLGGLLGRIFASRATKNEQQRSADKDVAKKERNKVTSGS